MKDYKPMYICGYCGKDTRDKDGQYHTRKVIFSGFADVLCNDCLKELKDEKQEVAIKYLNNEVNNDK